MVVSRDQRLRDTVSDLPLRLVENNAPERGISSSIALGVQALEHEADAALIGVADQPDLSADGLRKLVDGFRPGRIVVARYADHRGNPAIFDRCFFKELLGLDGDRGGQRVVEAHPEEVIDVSLPVEMGRDVDRPNDWPG